MKTRKILSIVLLVLAYICLVPGMIEPGQTGRNWCITAVALILASMSLLLFDIIKEQIGKRRWASGWEPTDKEYRKICRWYVKCLKETKKDPNAFSESYLKFGFVHNAQQFWGMDETEALEEWEKLKKKAGVKDVL